MEEIKKLLAELVVLALPIVIPMVILYLKGIKDQLVKSHGIQLSVAENAAINDAIEIGVRRAEEKGNQLLDSTFKRSGSEKQAIAIESARRVGPNGLSQFDDDAMKVLVDATVQRLRPALKTEAPKREGSWQENAARATGG